MQSNNLRHIGRLCSNFDLAILDILIQHHELEAYVDKRGFIFMVNEKCCFLDTL